MLARRINRSTPLPWTEWKDRAHVDLKGLSILLTLLLEILLLWEILGLALLMCLILCVMKLRFGVLRRGRGRRRWSRGTGDVDGRGWRSTRYRGLPRGSRQRGCIPWLYGLLHDGTHNFTDATTQPAAFFTSFSQRIPPPQLLFFQFSFKFTYYSIHLFLLIEFN